MNEKRCCGRQAQLYKSKGYFYCHKCGYCYDQWTHRSLGYRASGQTKTQLLAEYAAGQD